MSVSVELGKLFKRLGKDLGALASRVGFLEKNLAHLTTKVSVERTDADPDGVYRKITWRRQDGTIVKVSLLEHDPLLTANGSVYNKRVDSIYNKTGTQVVETASYVLVYDGNGSLVSETLL